jgi:mRNA interferase RelE/StbE
MPARTLQLPPELRNLIRHLHPSLKRKVRSALLDILEDPACGKPLKRELDGYWSLPIGRFRIIYRPDEQGIEIAAIGPRRSIYEDAAYQLRRRRGRS